MQHLAIMRPSLGFLEKILDGSKKIESRWYSSKRAQWGKIRVGETIFFKNSGQSVSARAQAAKIVQLENLAPAAILSLVIKYGKDMGVSQAEIPQFYNRVKDKKYCILIFLKNARRAVPFQINKAGFGAMTAWISAEKFKHLKI